MNSQMMAIVYISIFKFEVVKQDKNITMFKEIPCGTSDRAYVGVSQKIVAVK